MLSYKSKFQEKESLNKKHFREIDRFSKKIRYIENELKVLSSEILSSNLSKERRYQLQKINESLKVQLISLEKLRKNLDSL